VHILLNPVCLRVSASDRNIGKPLSVEDNKRDKAIARRKAFSRLIGLQPPLQDMADLGYQNGHTHRNLALKRLASATWQNGLSVRLKPELQFERFGQKLAGGAIWPHVRARLTKWLYDSYILHMSTHSVAEAGNSLPELIDRALNGEEIVIARDGQPVAELKPIPAPLAPGRRVTREDIEWLRRHRVELRSGSIDSVTLVRQLRNEDGER
jgi:antitoxin (DNA-binding transcriptional repressor) of toxin-antitoxin stability system